MGLLTLVFWILTCPKSCLRLFTRRPPPRLLNAAARAGLRPAPESRSRWAYHHLPRSCKARLSVHIEPISALLQRTLLLRVDGDDGLLLHLRRNDFRVDMLELGVSVGMVRAFIRLAIGLAREPEFHQLLAHGVRRSSRCFHLRQGRRSSCMLFDTQIKGHMGSPSVAGATRRSSAGTSPGSFSQRRATPAPSAANAPPSAAVLRRYHPRRD